MADMHRVRHDCRLCRSASVEKVLALAPSPPANELLTDSAQADKQDKFPLDLYFCNDCRHLQLLDIVDPGRLFNHYLYVSGTSPLFREHFRQYAGWVMENFPIEKGGLVVDIGSNDGVLLGCFRDAGMRIQGVDPAREIAEKANTGGIDTLVEFFTEQTARDIRRRKGAAEVIVANNVFAHIDDLHEILRGVEVLLDPKGILVIEVSYLKDVIEKTLFDTIYHEHLDYHSVGPLQRFFSENGFRLIDVNTVDTHGGSVRAVAQKQSGGYRERETVTSCIRDEDAAGLYSADTFRDFERKIRNLGDELLELLGRLKSENKKIAGYGLPAKATTLMHQFRIGPEYIDYVVDDNPLKQGLYSPGYGIPIYDGSRLSSDRPDCIIILAWNFADPIINKLKWFIDGGGIVIVPLPNLRVIET